MTTDLYALVDVRVSVPGIPWTGPAPTHCDLAGTPLTDKFVDGSLAGRWGCFHPGPDDVLAGRITR